MCNKVFIHTGWMIYKNNEPVHWYEDPQQGTRCMSPSSTLGRCAQQIQLCWKSPQDGSLFHWHICCTTTVAVPTVTRALHSAGCGYHRYPEKWFKYTDLASLLVILLCYKKHQGGWRQQGRYVKSKLQKTASFIVFKVCGSMHLQSLE
jgi:hypothetical protein